MLVGNTDSNILECSMAALSLALVFVGTCNDDIGSVILQRLMESSDEELNNTASRFMCLGTLSVCSVFVCFLVRSCDGCSVFAVLCASLLPFCSLLLLFNTTGLGLLYLGKGEKVEAVLEAVRTIEHARGRCVDLFLLFSFALVQM